jgi:hypothetical protein
MRQSLFRTYNPVFEQANLTTNTSAEKIQACLAEVMRSGTISSEIVIVVPALSRYFYFITKQCIFQTDLDVCTFTDEEHVRAVPRGCKTKERAPRGNPLFSHYFLLVKILQLRRFSRRQNFMRTNDSLTAIT